MSRNRLFNMLVVILLVTVIALTVREAAATAGILSQRDSTKVECLDLPSRYSIRTEYVKAAGMSMPYTEDGPTGVDGGLIDLLSSYRTCSK